MSTHCCQIGCRLWRATFVLITIANWLGGYTLICLIVVAVAVVVIVTVAVLVLFSLQYRGVNLVHVRQALYYRATVPDMP